MFTVEALIKPTKAGKIPAIEICKVSHPLVFAAWRESHFKVSEGFLNTIDIKSKQNTYSFSIDLESGDLTVFHEGKLDTTDNQLAIAAKYKELGLV